MSTILGQIRQDRKSSTKPLPRVYRTKYTSLPVNLPPSFLSPLPSANIHVEKIDFGQSPLPEYTNHHAFIIDGLLDQAECDELIRYAEMSAGGHGHSEQPVTFQAMKSTSQHNDEEFVPTVKPDGWHRALVRAGVNKEMVSLKHRNSDRIVWNCQDVATRIWKRVWQIEDVRRDLEVLEGDKYRAVMGDEAVERGERWRISERGMNESMKFLRYEGGGYFREHCDGTHETPDGSQKSFFTIHLYLNDSVATTSDDGLISLDLEEPSQPDPFHPSREMLRGGATTFHSRNLQHRLDVHPKAGRVLIFQQRGLLHSGDDVVKGVKFTMRSDVMYEYDDEGDDLFDE